MALVSGMSQKNHYKILGIGEHADIADINRAFRALAAVYHPDRNPGDREAEQRYKRITSAYDALKDEERRSNYDQHLRALRRERTRHLQFSIGIALFVVILCLPAVLIVLSQGSNSKTPLSQKQSYARLDADAPVTADPVKTASIENGASLRDPGSEKFINGAKPGGGGLADAGRRDARQQPPAGAGVDVGSSESAVPPRGERHEGAEPASKSNNPPKIAAPPLPVAAPEEPQRGPRRTAALEPQRDAMPDEQKDAADFKLLSGGLVEVKVGPGDQNVAKALKPGGGIKAAFRDCPECPEMTVLPAGQFLMGSKDGEDGREGSEGPQRIVSFSQPFAVSRFEISAAEWQACAADGGCRSNKLYRGKKPVGNVNWHDAMAYTVWLSKKTGKKYRLLSEAEWEYAARAQSETAYWWGDWIAPEQARYDSALIDAKPSAALVDAGSPNAWSLHHVHGNAAEWVQDCWHETYHGAPADGSARLDGDCSKRVLRGGSWQAAAGQIRSAARMNAETGSRQRSYGFRVARSF